MLSKKLECLFKKYFYEKDIKVVPGHLVQSVYMLARDKIIYNLFDIIGSSQKICKELDWYSSFHNRIRNTFINVRNRKVSLNLLIRELYIVNFYPKKVQEMISVLYHIIIDDNYQITSNTKSKYRKTFINMIYVVHEYGVHARYNN
jgi:predicted transcriptional regulator